MAWEQEARLIWTWIRKYQPLIKETQDEKKKMLDDLEKIKHDVAQLKDKVK